jgi:RNA-directed DNA polymerase
LAKAVSPTPEQISEMVNKYWSTPGHKWEFSATVSTKRGLRRYMVQRLSSIGIRRHIKVIADANPYLPKYGGYFWRRRADRSSRLFPASSARAYRPLAL